MEFCITKAHTDLIVLCRKGDRRAQNTIYEQYAHAMYTLSFRMLKNHEDAEDVLQEAFAEAFDKLGYFRLESTFGAWLKRILINRCINKLRRRRLHVQLVDDMHAFAEIPDETPEETGLNLEAVKKAMLVLPDSSREIFSLYLLEGYDHAEIAQILNTSVSNSKTQLWRAKQRIRDVLSRQEFAA